MKAEFDHTTKPSSRANEDIALVNAILDGSLTAWHRFLEHYAGLIHTVVRRHLFAEDDDDVRTVCVDILKALHDSDIRKYRGDATLATWLIVHARSRAIDFVRRRYGRHRPPKWYEELGDLDRDVMRLFFVERLPLDVVMHALAWSGHDASVEEIVESVQRIEARADARAFAWTMAEDSARALGLRSHRMVHWIMQMRLEYEEKAARSRPDAVLAEKEASEQAERLRRALERLPGVEREVAERRFAQGRAAAAIDAELHLGGERRTYTIINRIIRKLRRTMIKGNEAGF